MSISDNSARQLAAELKSYIDLCFIPIEKRIASIEDQISLLPTKDEFITRMDRWWVEFKKMDMELTAHSAQVRRNTDDIVSLKSKL